MTLIERLLEDEKFVKSKTPRELKEIIEFLKDGEEKPLKVPHDKDMVH